VTAPMTPAPAPGSTAVASEAPGTPPAAAPGQAPTPPPADNSPPGGGQSETDAAAGDPMAWLTAAELDARYGAVERPTLDTGVLGA